jgi:hypothetical protein
MPFYPTCSIFLKWQKNRTFDAQLEENKITRKEEVVTYFTVETPAPALREN